MTIKSKLVHIKQNAITVYVILQNYEFNEK